MDKNAIKKYAVWARRELISRVSQKALQYGIAEDSIVPATAASVNGVVLSDEEVKQRKALIEQISSKGYEQVMEEVAYTWFNRFIALRFMEVNGYLPSHVRVFTDEDNNFKPQILAEAINLELDGLDMERVYALKDANDNDTLFKYLVIVQCNALNPILPGMFQKIDDYTVLLFPDNLLREGSVIQQMIEMIPEEDWKDAVQIIGWLYQYYNSEKKDEVFAALKKNVKITKENIPAATQLFTPDWIVRYMVENSLGRLWLEGHPDAKDQLLPTQEEQSAFAAGNRDPEDIKWHYYLEEAEQEPDVQAQLAQIRKEYAALTPEQIKVIDPCCGSGHILAYMFDVLMQIYEVYGYSVREAVRNIVENNIYGLDIDERAAQLAYFAVMMKARQYDRRFLARKDEDDNPDVPQPHVYAIVESNHLDKYAVEYFVGGDAKLKAALNTIIQELHDAKEYGSILTVTPQDWSALYHRFDEIEEDIDLSREVAQRELLPLVQVAQILTRKFDAVVTNPPYMGAGGMDNILSDFVKMNYPDTKSDLSTIFMEKTISMCKEHGYMAMINIPVWMFLSTYEKMRNTIIARNTITTMLHFGRGVFGSDFGTTAFTIQKGSLRGYKGSYRRLFEKQGAVDSIETKEKWFFEGKGFYISTQHRFSNIPGNPVAYWMSDSVENDFLEGKPLSSVSEIKQGLKTGDNDKFLRLWFEVSSDKFSPFSGSKWYPCNKGGDYRRWYGNNDYVINWENDGFELKNFRHPDGRQKSRPQNLQYQFKEGLTYTNISSSKFGIRYCPPGFAFDAAGSMIFTDKCRMYYLLGLLSSNTVLSFTSILSPTMSFEVGQISNIPYIERKSSDIDRLVQENIDIAKQEWDSFETSWDFQRHPLIEVIAKGGAFFERGNIHLSECFSLWENECKERFYQMKANEESLNRMFIEIYGLQKELSADVDDADITIRLADKKRDIKSLISYAVGCMFGRYSLDVDGLVFAGGVWDDTKYITFKADKDGIIPICDDEYFADDIVGRFVKFIEIVYGKTSLEENLCFIADALGGSGRPKDVIRKYFMDEFYTDHCSIYSVTGSGKRPIYWLFDSGKKGGFRALVYMHRYQPDTIARMRTDYVHEQQARYRTAIADLEQRIASASTSERVKLSKRLKTLQEQATEIQGYEEKIHHLADQYISIDLDDGVKKNYEIFKDVLAKIK
jgi:type II restriction/modification system DNA methylase subunit YeeA